jgi:thiol-disulfide isomerase/thioredoxin
MALSELPCPAELIPNGESWCRHNQPADSCGACKEIAQLRAEVKQMWEALRMMPMFIRPEVQRRVCQTQLECDAKRCPVTCNDRGDMEDAVEAAISVVQEAVDAALSAQPEERPAESVASVCVCGICPYCIRELRKDRDAEVRNALLAELADELDRVIGWAAPAGG